MVTVISKCFENEYTEKGVIEMKMEINKVDGIMELKVHIFGTVVYYFSESVEGLVREFDNDYKRVCRWRTRLFKRSADEKSAVEEAAAIVAFNTMTEAKKMLEMMPF